MFEVDQIYNVDCLEGLKRIPSDVIDLICTDPPYGINFIPPRKSSKQRHGDIPITNDDISGNGWIKWFLPICMELYRTLKKDHVAYFFSGFNSYYYYYYVLNLCGFEIKANIIWVKNNFGLGYHFRRQYEQVLVAFKGKPKTPETAMSDVIFADKVNGADLKHSCQKPIDLLYKLISQYSNEDDVVLDPFMGSGSTAVACRQLGRHYIGFEIDGSHYKTCLNRIKGCSARLDEFIDKKSYSKKLDLYNVQS